MGRSYGHGAPGAASLGLRMRNIIPRRAATAQQTYSYRKMVAEAIWSHARQRNRSHQAPPEECAACRQGMEWFASLPPKVLSDLLNEAQAPRMCTPQGVRR